MWRLLLLLSLWQNSLRFFSEMCCGLLWIAILFLLCVALASVCRWCDLTVLVCRGWACECVQRVVVSFLWICVIALQPTLSITQSALHGEVEGRARALLYLSRPPQKQRGAAAHSSVSARLQTVELAKHTSGFRKGRQWLMCYVCIFLIWTGIGEVTFCLKS